MQRFDELDMRILSELTKDASISVPRLSKKLNVNASVLYSRIKRLAKRSLIKNFTVIVNESMLGINVKATVGINRDPKLNDSEHKRPYSGGITQCCHRSHRQDRRHTEY